MSSTMFEEKKNVQIARFDRTEGRFLQRALMKSVKRVRKNGSPFLNAAGVEFGSRSAEEGLLSYGT